ncbi:hypothetical protein ABPG75_006470 [Micractinium tetrahymenae]
MLRLPRTAGAAKKPPPAATGSGDASPTGVLQPLPQRRSASSKAAQRDWADDRAPEGHAQDVLHLLNAGWFGPLGRSKSAQPIDDSDGEALPLPPRLRRTTQQRQQAADGDGSSAPLARAASDGSPASGSTSQHSGGGSTGSVAAQQQQQHGRAVPLLPAAMPAQPVLSAREAATAAAVQDLPGIGTWAGRYRLFGRQQQQQAEQGQAQGMPAAANQQQLQQREQPAADAPQLQRGGNGSFGSFVVLRPGGFGGGTQQQQQQQAEEQQQRAAVYGSEQAQEEAWRWRFSRKWATEQQRYYEGEPGQPASMVSDDLDAMAFTQACGVGVNLQIMPNSAIRRSTLAASAGDEGQLGLEASTSHLSLCQFDVDASYMSGGVLSADMSPGGSAHGARGAEAALRLQRATSGGLPPACAGAGAGRGQAAERRQHGGNGWQGGAAPSPRGPSATRTVLSMASKARDLLQKQGAIEAEVEDRWERARSAGGSWVGASLQAVCIDMYGRFKYCVLRVSDSAGHTRFLVRGRAGASPASLLEAARQEAAAVARADGLPPATVEVVGGGLMEWRQDTERELVVQPSALVGEAVQAAGSGSPTKTPYLGDMSGLTASLVRQALPCHFRITAGAGRGTAGGGIAANRI